MRIDLLCITAILSTSLTCAAQVQAEPTATTDPLRHAVETDPDNLRAHLALIDRYDADRDIGRAEQAVDAALTKFGERPALLARQSFIQWTKGEHDEALKTAERAMSLDADDPEAVAAKVRALYTLDRAEEALSLVKEARKAHPEHLRLMLAEAGALGANHQWAPAMALNDAVLERDPDNIAALHNAASYYCRFAKTRDRGVAYFERCNELAAQPAYFYHQRGVMYDQADDPEQALADYKRAADAEPNDAFYLYAYGESLRKLDQFDQAMTSFEKLLQLYPVHIKAICSRGRIFLAWELPDEALGLYRLAAETDDEHYYPYFRMAYFYRDIRDYDKCIAAWDQAIKRSAEPADIIWRRGDAHDSFGQEQRALDDYRRALSLDPLHEQAADAFIRTLPTAQAIQRCVAQAERDPHNPLWPAKIGYYYYITKQHKKAVQAYSRAIEIDPDYWSARRGRGQLLDNLDEFQQSQDDHTHIINYCKDNDSVARAYFDRGVTRSSWGRHKVAEQDYLRSIEGGLVMPASYYNLGYQRFKIGKHLLAIESLSEAIRMHPRYAKAYSFRGGSYAMLGEHKRALEDLDTAKRYGSSLVNFGLLYASKCHRQLGELDRALEVAQELNQGPNQYTDFLGELAAVRLARGETQEADQITEQIYGLGERQWYTFSTARRYFVAGDLDRAKKELLEGLKHGANPATVYLMLFMSEMAGEDLEQSLVYANKHHEVASESPWGYLYKAFVIQQQGEPERAKALLRQGIEKASQYRPTYHVLSVLAGDVDIQKQFDQTPETYYRFELAFYYGYWCLLQGDTASAKQWLGAASQGNPDNWEVYLAQEILNNLTAEEQPVEEQP